MDWLRRTANFDPLMVPGLLLARAFYAALALGPVVIVVWLDRPPLIVGVVAAIFGFGIWMWLLVQGSVARLLAILSVESGDEAQTHAIAAVLGAIVGIAWLVLVTGIWAAAVEHSNGVTSYDTSDYALLALWHVGNAIPLLDVPHTLGYPNPPIESWGLETGIALLLLAFAVVFSIVMVVGELIVRGRRP
jgi:hypothetical protein